MAFKITYLMLTFILITWIWQLIFIMINFISKFDYKSPWSRLHQKQAIPIKYNDMKNKLSSNDINHITALVLTKKNFKNITCNLTKKMKLL